MGNNAGLGSLKRRKKKSRQSSIEMDADTLMDFYDKRDEVIEDNGDVNDDEDSEIQEFYKGKNVLVTGASGFIGTILLEKLLRSTDVNKVYILFRGKKAQSLEDRVREYFSEDAFDRVRKEKPNFTQRVVVLPADLQEDGLGLDEETRNVLLEEINLVFHVAATVKFDEHLRVAYKINIKGTETLLNMAEHMKHLDAFVYVSTAYSNCHKNHIEEKFYEPIYKQTELKQILESSQDVELTILNEILIKPMPNTYTLTKNSAEHMCKLRLDKIPLAIVRPSIVMPVVEEPCPYWSKGMTGLTAMFVAVGLGIMRTVYKNSDNVIDIVPGDYVINIILGAGFDIGTGRQRAEVRNREAQQVQEQLFDANNNPVDKNKKFIDENGNERDERGFEKLQFEPGHNNDRDYNAQPNPAVYDGGDNQQPDDNSVEQKQSDETTSDPIYNMVSYVENPIKLGESTKLVIHYSSTSGEGCNQSLWVIHHNPTNRKWLFFIYFYLYNILPTLLFFQYLEKFSGRKSQLMKIYRKVFFLNNTIATFTINEWKFSTGNAQRLERSLRAKDRALFKFSVRDVRWDKYHSLLHRALGRYAVFATVSKHLYKTRIRYIKIADAIFLNSCKLLLVYAGCALFLFLVRYVERKIQFVIY